MNATYDREKQIAENAARAFADHVVAVEHEHGLYRHYRCAKPGTGVYAFHVVTFPGRLIVSGDVGDMAWSRCPDMLEWAAGAVESIGYFAEKVWGSIPTKEWSEDVAKAVVEEKYKDTLGDVLIGLSRDSAETAKGKLDDVRETLLGAAECGREEFADAYCRSDWYGGDFPDLQDYTAEFLWTREAVRWFLKWYKARGA